MLALLVLLVVSPAQAQLDEPRTSRAEHLDRETRIERGRAARARAPRTEARPVRARSVRPEPIDAHFGVHAEVEPTRWTVMTDGELTATEADAHALGDAGIGVLLGSLGLLATSIGLGLASPIRGPVTVCERGFLARPVCRIEDGVVGHHDELLAPAIALGMASALGLVLDVALLFLPADQALGDARRERERRGVELSTTFGPSGGTIGVRLRL